MKKVSLFLGMVLAASFAMAQNSANISQTGLNHKSENTQKTGTGNAITVEQIQEGTSTKGYISEITQDGSSNKADVVQGGQPQDYPQGSNGGSSVEINQTGISHDAKVTQNANPGALAKVTQKGVNQLTEVWNANNTGDATVYQDGQVRNNAYLYQNRGSSNGFIRQVGESNLSLVNQLRDDNSTVVQEGNSNVSYVKQNRSGNVSGNSVGNIYQYGSNNGTGTFVPGEMKGHNEGGHTAKIDGATVFIKQSTANLTTANIYQGGDAFGKIVDVYNNAAGIDQDLATANSNATITQLSDDNTANITQTGLNEATVTQKTGDYNVVNLLQAETDLAVITQDGSYNTVKGLTGVWAKGQNLTVDQIGTRNELAIEADGTVVVTQDNSTVASASALGNKIEFSQIGGGTSNLSQTGGDANLIKLTKTGGGTADITQTGNTNKVAMFDDVFGAAGVTGAALFNGADLDITQTGDGNLLNLNSTTAGAVVDVMQNGMNNKASVVQN